MTFMYMVLIRWFPFFFEHNHLLLQLWVFGIGKSHPICHTHSVSFFVCVSCFLQLHCMWSLLKASLYRVMSCLCLGGFFDSHPHVVVIVAVCLSMWSMIVNQTTDPILLLVPMEVRSLYFTTHLYFSLCQGQEIKSAEQCLALTCNQYEAIPNHYKPHSTIQLRLI